LARRRLRIAHAPPARAEQDAKIQDICSTVSSLRRTSAAIHEELKLQASLVESIERDVDRTGARVRKAEQKSAAIAGVRSETLGPRGEGGGSAGGGLLCSPQRGGEGAPGCAVQ